MNSSSSNNQLTNSSTKDFQSYHETPSNPSNSPPATPSLNYFNMRVTERLHRYRALRRQWQEISTSIANDPISQSKCSSPVNFHESSGSTLTPSVDLKVFSMNEFVNPSTTSITTTLREKSARTISDDQPLNNRIQQDLLRLRRLIKNRQEKTSKFNGKSQRSTENLKSANSNSRQENKTNSTTRDKSSSHQRKSAQQTKTIDSTPNTEIYLQTRNLSKVATNHNSSASNQTSLPSRTANRTSNVNQILDFYRHRENSSLPFDSTIQGIAPFRHTQMSSSKVSQSTRPQSIKIVRKKTVSIVKREAYLSPIQSSIVVSQPPRLNYTFSGSSSARIPRIERNFRNSRIEREDPILSILFSSTTCLGKQQRCYSENSTLVDFQQILSRLPKAVVQQNEEDEYAILLDQLDHIRTKMPKVDVYEYFQRVPS